MKLTLSFPGPLRLDISVALAFVLMVLQLATGTTLEFAELTFLGIVFAVATVNLLGGLSTVAGCCVAVVALKMFAIAQLGKVYFREPGQSHLHEPIVTMAVMTLSMVCLCAAALVSASFQPRRVLLKPVLHKELLRTVAVFTFIVGMGSFLLAQFCGVSEEGSIQLGGMAGVLRRISGCAPLAIVAGTAYTIIDSRGTRILSFYNGLPFFSQIAIGILFTSKQGLFDPLFYLIATGMAFRYTWRFVHLALGIFAALLAIFVLFPFAQVARNYTRGANIKDTFQKTIAFFDDNLRNPHYLVDQYIEYHEDLSKDETGRYFDKPSGLLERMSLVKPADSLISATLQQGASGWTTITSGLVDLVPRVILPRRYVNIPNELGYKAGFVDEDNFATCISFGFAADAFSSFKWIGVAVISFVVGLLLVAVTRLLTPGLHSNIWAVVFLGSYQLTIAEASFGGVLQLFIYQTAWIVATLCAVLLAAWIWQYITSTPVSLATRSQRENNPSPVSILAGERVEPGTQ